MISAAHAPSGRPHQIATRIVFFVMGFGVAAWAPLIPFVKARAGIGDDILGLLLLSLGAGSMLTMPLAGALAGRFGCRLVIVLAAVLLCITLPLLATLSSLAGLVPVLLLFGAGVGAADVAGNIQAIIVERDSGRPMMSGFHGLFSLGGIAGAGGVSLLLRAGASPSGAIWIAIAVIALATAVAAPRLLTHGLDKDGVVFAVPRGIVLLIGALCFIVFLAEGAVLDWSGVFLTAVRGVAASDAGLGYAAFALTMTVSRLIGDGIVARLGGARTILLGGICAAAGFMVTWVPDRHAAFLGFALVGVGCANIVPILFSSVGRQTVMPQNVAVAAITTLGYAGILVGPAGIGIVAQWSSLEIAFLLLAALLLVVGVSGRGFARRQ
ncbi:MFS transporter [Vineibacter terrae]|uniref:MFS transporter n=1 Tax=Vineibacter terrae TaxID=2586908 RepID=A0A5C8P7K8_9HYPH|nr:MFS transporter [Vineibacter terrae]TXL69362.1 MFS transporter [Vineibacter terrae]